MVARVVYPTVLLQRWKASGVLVLICEAHGSEETLEEGNTGEEGEEGTAVDERTAVYLMKERHRKEWQ